MAEWGDVLSSLKSEDVERGFSQWQEDWPPSATEFLKVCKVPVVQASHRQHVGLPRPRVNQAIATEQVGKIRSLLGGSRG